MKFEIELKYEIEEGVEVKVRVTGNYVAATSGSRRGNPDSWTQGQAAYVEDLKVFNEKGTRMPQAEDQLVIDGWFNREVEKEVERTL